ncbi:MAG: hypothetical protein J1F18_11035 [Lachnospiraceae bacterium]|nr:hypothetical protein [Lachnospiraceae bacterium]
MVKVRKHGEEPRNLSFYFGASVVKYRQAAHFRDRYGAGLEVDTRMTGSIYE